MTKKDILEQLEKQRALRKRHHWGPHVCGLGEKAEEKACTTQKEIDVK